MKISALTPTPENPRTITPAKAAQLKRALAEFGDLSGIVFNAKTKHLVGGNQRSKQFDKSAKIVYTKKYAKPTRTGTVAEGYIEVKGERFAYREVSWPLAREKAANLAANKNAGEWDLPQVSAWVKELSNFDLAIDLDLTMFDADERSELPPLTEVSGHTRVGGAGSDDDEDDVPPLPKCKPGQLYELGSSQLRCGPEELEFCDRIIKRFEAYSGQEAVLIERPKKKAAKQSSYSHAQISQASR